MTEVYSEALRQRMLTQTLDNGLQVFVFPKPGFSKSFAMLATNYGSVDSAFETARRRGPFSRAQAL